MFRITGNNSSERQPRLPAQGGLPSFAAPPITTRQVSAQNRRPPVNRRQSGGDIYDSFAALKAAEPNSFSITLREDNTPVAILAPHGGRIEPGTSEITRAVAKQDLSYYTFDGKLPAGQGNRRLHITSTRFDEPLCEQILANCRVAIVIHGAAGTEEAVYIGGLAENAKRNISRELQAAGFTVDVHSNPDLQGREASNICNRGLSRQGVQLEISAGLRQSLTSNQTRIRQFAAAIRRGINDAPVMRSRPLQI